VHEISGHSGSDLVLLDATARTVGVKDPEALWITAVTVPFCKLPSSTRWWRSMTGGGAWIALSLVAD
jgi:hypothetical protein